MLNASVEECLCQSDTNNNNMEAQHPAQLTQEVGDSFTAVVTYLLSPSDIVCQMVENSRKWSFWNLEIYSEAAVKFLKLVFGVAEYDVDLGSFIPCAYPLAFYMDLNNEPSGLVLRWGLRDSVEKWHICCYSRNCHQ